MNVSSPSGVKEAERAIRAGCRGRLLLQEPLARHTTIKVGGPADLWFEPENEEALAGALRAASETGCPAHVFGGGSNLLVPDEGMRGLTVHLAGPRFEKIGMRGESVVAGAGLALPLFLKFLIENDKGDCEFLAGVPAQVGGAVMMNAGSATHWIGSHVASVRVVEFGGRILEIAAADIPFGYRTSGLGRLVITEAAFHFPAADARLTRERLASYADYRRQTQDLKRPNAGCMFRNPAPGDKSAGQLIEEAGLKGTRIGGAQISEIHANFVVNVGGAKQRDVLDLLELSEETVRQKFGVRLKREIKILE